MGKILIVSLIGCLSILYNVQISQAQAVAEGKITNANTGEFLQGAHVFLSGTTIGTVTNPLGYYRLQRIPPGAHRLVVSMIGYGRKLIEIEFSAGEAKGMDIKLEPVVYEMDEIYVGNLDERWKKHQERFTRLFIGESKYADSVKILNPEVLRFEILRWGRFSAEALAPLQIENRALGYHVTYFLKEFNHSGSRTRWDGEPFFTELTPVDSLQAAYWKQNRTEAFYGSLRHFLLALLQDRVSEDGFILYNLPLNVYGILPQNRHRTTSRHLIREGDTNYHYRLNFFGRLKIIYKQGEEDWRYIRWTSDPNRSPSGVQTSYLKLRNHPVTINTDGEILEPYGATQFGYFAFHRLADLTPREYRPEGYQNLSVSRK